MHAPAATLSADGKAHSNPAGGGRSGGGGDLTVPMPAATGAGACCCFRPSSCKAAGEAKRGVGVPNTPRSLHKALGVPPASALTICNSETTEEIVSSACSSLKTALERRPSSSQNRSDMCSSSLVQHSEIGGNCTGVREARYRPLPRVHGGTAPTARRPPSWRYYTESQQLLSHADQCPMTNPIK